MEDDARKRLVRARNEFRRARIDLRKAQLDSFRLKIIVVILALLNKSPAWVLLPAMSTFPSFFDPLSGKKKLPSLTWDELDRDNCHIVVSAKPTGEVVVVNVRHQTTFTITGVPAQFSRTRARF